MSIYVALLNALNTMTDSPEVGALLALLDAPGKLKKIGGYQAKLDAKASGVHLSFAWSQPSWLLTSAILYPGGVERFGRFRDLIENRVPLSASRSEVQDALGSPSWSGGGGPPLMSILTDYHWDRFDFPEHSVRFDYQEEYGVIRIVSVMTRELMLQLNRNRA